MVLVGQSNMHGRKIYFNGHTDDKLFIYAFGTTYDVTDSVGSSAVTLTPTTAASTYSLDFNNNVQDSYNDANNGTGTLPFTEGSLGDLLMKYIFKLRHPQKGHTMTLDEKRDSYFKITHTSEGVTKEIGEYSTTSQHPAANMQNSNNNVKENSWAINIADLTFDPELTMDDINKKANE